MTAGARSAIIAAVVISRPTVLVLGAGSSVDFGYPTGAKLRDEIVNIPPGRMRGTSGEDDEDEDQVLLFREFQKQLRASALTTIDAFEGFFRTAESMKD